MRVEQRAPAHGQQALVGAIGEGASRRATPAARMMAFMLAAGWSRNRSRISSGECGMRGTLASSAVTLTSRKCGPAAPSMSLRVRAHRLGVVDGGHATVARGGGEGVEADPLRGRALIARRAVRLVVEHAVHEVGRSQGGHGPARPGPSANCRRRRRPRRADGAGPTPDRARWARPAPWIRSCRNSAADPRSHTTPAREPVGMHDCFVAQHLDCRGDRLHAGDLGGEHAFGVCAFGFWSADCSAL